MTRVYRMENVHHQGPFNYDLLASHPFLAERMWRDVPWIEVEPEGALASLDGRHPHHLDDVLHVPSDFDGYANDVFGMHPIAGEWWVGCKDLRQFYHWFPRRALPDFAECGQLLHVYECPDEAIRQGHYQLMFDRKRAKLARTLDLSAKHLAA